MRWRAEGGPARWADSNGRMRPVREFPLALRKTRAQGRVPVQPTRKGCITAGTVDSGVGRGVSRARPDAGRTARSLSGPTSARAAPGSGRGARARLDVAVGALNANVGAVDLRPWRCDRKRGADEASCVSARRYLRAVGERVRVDLTDDERELLARGLFEWGGPASPTNEFARLLGFADVEALNDAGGSIARNIQSG